MYNYQKYQRQQRLSVQNRNAYKDFVKDQQTRQCKYFVRIVKNKAFDANHKRRVDVFMGETIVSPLQISEYIPPKYDPRGFLAEKKLLKPFRMNFHTSQERINDLEKTNSFFDGVPFRNSSTHKFRQFTSTSGEKPLKFKPNSTTSRLVDFLTLQRTNQIDVLDQSKSKEILKNRKNHLYFFHYLRFVEKSIKDLSKQVMPVLHRKAYWNSLKAVLVEQAPSSVNDKQNDREINQKSIKISQEVEQVKKSVIQGIYTNEEVNRKSNAIQALTKCCAIKCKLDKSLSKILRV